jgi:hypothetical protein
MADELSVSLPPGFVSIAGNGMATLTAEERLLVNLNAHAIAGLLLPLKKPMRRGVLDQVRWLLGEDA